MEKLNVNEYLSLDDTKKRDYLTLVIGNKELRMIGKVQKVVENYCKVVNIRTISSEMECDLFMPFQDSDAQIQILGTGAISKELEAKGIEEGKVIFFSLVPNMKKYEDEGKYFTVMENSVAEAVNCEEFYKSIELEKSYSRVFNYFSRNNEENKIYFIQDLKKAHEDIIKDIEGKKLERKDITDEIQKLTSNLSNLEDEYQSCLKSIETRLEEEQRKKEQGLDEKLNAEKEIRLQEIKKISEKLAELKKYNLLWQEDKTSTTEDEDKIYKEDIKERIKHIQAYLMLCNKKNLYYKESTIKSLYAGLKTDQIIILAGKPGSGKTSLIEGFSEAIDAVLSLIPVQPNWMDKSDLLGFYNPIEKSYVSTPFLDALLKASREAENNSEKLFFICLDEMNLSHVEYYFAEFLSKLQTDRKVQLYSRNIYEDIKEEIEERISKFKTDIGNLTIESFLLESDGEGIDNYLKLKKQYKMLIRYPYEILIPQNVKFLGTINKDETTKDLSPKVIDRSFIIKLENQMNKKEKKKLEEIYLADKEIYTKKLDLSYRNIAVEYIDFEDELEDEIQAIKDKILKFNIILSNRFDKTINQLATGESFSNRKELLDFAISSLIFPKINFSSDDEDLDELIDVISNISAGYPISSDILKWMTSYRDDKLTFWR